MWVHGVLLYVMSTLILLYIYVYGTTLCVWKLYVHIHLTYIYIYIYIYIHTVCNAIQKCSYNSYNLLKFVVLDKYIRSNIVN